MTSRSAVILAGGRSSRMGLPKAVLPFGGSTILERLIHTLKDAFTEIIVVAAPRYDEPFSIDRTLKKCSGLILERDDTAFQGPVGALRRGLMRARGEIAFACSCDLPLLRSDVADAICTRIENNDAAIPEIEGFLQPLCAAYRREPAAAALGAMEHAGERRLTALADRLKTRAIGEAALRPIDPDLRSFLDVNTAEDYARALRIARTDLLSNGSGGTPRPA
jgi:molybdopterin-guanine dinucleotide biosynthesis protein A